MAFPQNTLYLLALSRIHVSLLLLFSAFITHGYLPNMFMKTVIVPIIKNNSRDSDDKNNYRLIALVKQGQRFFNYVSQLFQTII